MAGPAPVIARARTAVRVSLTSRLEELADDIRGRGGECVPIALDVTDPESLPEAFAGVTHVYHVAAAIDSGRSERDLLERIATDSEALARANTAHPEHATLARRAADDRAAVEACHDVDRLRLSR